MRIPARPKIFAEGFQGLSKAKAKIWFRIGHVGPNHPHKEGQETNSEGEKQEHDAEMSKQLSANSDPKLGANAHAERPSNRRVDISL
jgi:hypothetical protein